MEQFDVPDADGPDGVSVIGQLEMEKGIFWTGSRISLLPVLHRHFQSDFDGRRPVIGIEHGSQPLGRDSNKFAGKAYGRWIGETEQGRVSDIPNLRPQGAIQSWMPV